MVALINNDSQKRSYFFALYPTKAQAKTIKQYTEQLIKDTNAKPIATEKLHLTLLYLGKLEKKHLDSVLIIAKEIIAKKFHLVIDKPLYWQQTNILYLSVKKPFAMVENLHHRLKEALIALGLKFDQKGFIPHITIARNCPPLTIKEDFSPITLDVSKFYLLSSYNTHQGSIYDIVQSFELR